MTKLVTKEDRDAVERAIQWAKMTPLKMGSKEFEDGIRALLRGAPYAKSPEGRK